MKNKKRFKLKCIVFLIIYIFALIPFNNVRAYDTTDFKKIMSVEQIKEDLDLVIKNIHTNYSSLPQEVEDNIKKSQDLIKKPKTLLEFYFILSELFSSFNDMHTYVDTYQPSIYCTDYLGIPFIWLDGSIIVNQNMGNYKIGDKIIEIGGKKVEELEKMYSTVMFTENKYSLHDQSNYFLLNRFYLEYFNLTNIDNTVNVLIESSGETKLIKEIFSPYGIFNLPKHKWVEYSIEKDNSIGYFYLNSCNEIKNPSNPKEYENAVNDFFIQVDKNNIKTVILDLRENTGGSPNLIMKFIDHFYISSYYLQSNIGFDDSKHYNKNFDNKEGLFKGKVYVLIGNRTISAAVLIADIFRDNKLATLIGEPAGQRTSYNSNGVINKFSLPNSKFNCRLQSSTLVSRPISYDDGKDALYPDVYIPRTREDIINNNDPHMNYIRKICAQNEKYAEWNKVLEVDEFHEFTINFNKDLDKTSINSNNIYIENNFGAKYETTVEFIDNRSIKIKAERSFTPEMTYSLFVKNIKDSTDKTMENIKVNFIIKK